MTEAAREDPWGALHAWIDDQVAEHQLTGDEVRRAIEGLVAHVQFQPERTVSMGAEDLITLAMHQMDKADIPRFDGDRPMSFFERLRRTVEIAGASFASIDAPITLVRPRAWTDADVRALMDAWKKMAAPGKYMVVVKPGADIETISEEAMRRAGWIRASESGE